MSKKILSILCILLLTAGLVELFLYMRAGQRQVASRLGETNSAIQALESERRGLEAQLAELEAAEAEESEDLADATEGADGVAPAPAGNLQAVLSLSMVYAQTYDEIYPALQGRGLTGILILRNGQLPGDSRMISVTHFLEMVNNGWAFAIYLDREPDVTDEAWQQSIEDYLYRIRRRTGVLPTIYCIPEGGCTAAEAELLTNEGFDTVALYQEPEETGDLRVIQILPYRADDLVERMAGMNGYCSLEARVGWTEVTEEPMRYSAEELTALLDNGGIEFKSLTDLQPMVAVPPEPEVPEEEDESDVSPYNDTDAIRQRLAEIELEISALYQ